MHPRPRRIALALLIGSACILAAGCKWTARVDASDDTVGVRSGSAVAAAARSQAPPRLDG